MGINEYWIITDSQFMLPRDGQKKIFVVLDGISRKEGYGKLVKDVLADRRDHDRLVICSSMATLGKRNREDDDLAKITPYFMNSWVKEEYLAAIRNEVFFALVDAMESVLNNADLVKYCGGNYHHETIHKLYGMYRYGSDGKVLRGRIPVSSYVASCFAAKCDEQAITELVSKLNSSRNPSLDGRMLEWLFLASVATRKVKLFGGMNGVDILPQANVLPFDPTKRFKRLDKRGICQRGMISRCKSDGTYDIHFGDGWQETNVPARYILPDGESYGDPQRKFEVGDVVKTQPSPKLKADQKWLQPVKWNQGGYDAVHFDSETGQVIFIQVIRSDKRDFKIYEVLEKLKESGMSPDFTATVFVVVKPDKWLEFKLDSIVDRDLLIKYDARWAGSEERRVKVRAFEASPFYYSSQPLTVLGGWSFF